MKRLTASYFPQRGSLISFRSISALAVTSAIALTVLYAIHRARALSPAAGDLIGNVALPQPGTGVSVAVDCNGNVYYTVATNSDLFKMDKNGMLLSATPITNAAGGGPLFMDEMSWDNGRQVLWAQEHGTNPINIYTLVPATGVATFKFAAGSSVGIFRDGIAYDGTDDTLWISGDVSTVIDHVKASDGTPAVPAQITPKDAMGNVLGAISGVTVGVGDLLYLGRNGNVQIVKVKKSNGDFIGSFASPGGARDEGLECDPVNFAPKLALWSREFNAPGFMSAIELEPGTCACGGGEPVCPLTQGYWKNHSEAWPASALPMTLGCLSYTQAQLLTILETPVGTGKSADATLILAHQLIAARLNIANGAVASPAVTQAISDATLALCANAVGSGVKPSSAAGQQMTALADILDQFNNGLLTTGCSGL